MKPRAAQGAQSRAPRPWGLTPVLEVLHETHHSMCTELYVQLRLAGPANCPEPVVPPGTRLAFSLPACSSPCCRRGFTSPVKPWGSLQGFSCTPAELVPGGWAGPDLQARPAEMLPWSFRASAQQACGWAIPMLSNIVSAIWSGNDEQNSGENLNWASVKAQAVLE